MPQFSVYACTPVVSRHSVPCQEVTMAIGDVLTDINAITWHKMGAGYILNEIVVSEDKQNVSLRFVHPAYLEGRDPQI